MRRAPGPRMPPQVIVSWRHHNGSPRRAPGGRDVTCAPMPAHLDHPADAEVVDRYGFFASGWVWLDKEQPKIAAVEIWSGGAQVAETDELHRRPDVCAALSLDPAARTGFRALACVPAAARGATIDVSVKVRFANGSRSAVLCGRSVRSVGFDDAPRPTIARPGHDDFRPGPSKTEAWPLPPDHLQVRQVAGVWNRKFYGEGRVLLIQLAAAFGDAGVDLSAAR